jgi:hypothetical protein
VAAPLQQDQVAVAITLAVALTWVKLFDLLTSSGVLEQVRRAMQRSGWLVVCKRSPALHDWPSDGLPYSIASPVCWCVPLLCAAEAEPQARARNSWPDAAAILAHL